MSAEETKPVVAETPAAEPAPATETPAPAAEAGKPAEPAAEVKPEAAAAEPATEATAAETPAEEKKEEKKEKVVEPITKGYLDYKVPSFPKSLIFSKKYFWFGEDAIPVENLSSYLRGEKAEPGYSTAAWSSQTGKGLLYFVKHEAGKTNPSGVICLAEATDLAKDGLTEFLFKASGHKHVFRTSSSADRDGWFMALEKAIEEAKAAKEGVTSSEGYKEVKSKLSKPFSAAVPAVAAAKAESSTPKKSTEVKPEEAATRDNASSSSSSSDEDKKKSKKSKSKSRSVSRGKRASIFGAFMGKKEEHDVKKEEKKTEKEEEKEEKKEEETPAVAAAAPVDGPSTDAPAEEAKPAETEAAAATEAAPAEEKKEAPKPVKRGSIFGTLAGKLRSPTHEKKESEVAPVVPPKDEETPAPAATETTEEAKPAEPAATTEAAPAEEKKEEKKEEKVATPAKEKKHFFDSFLGGKEKAKTPTTETAPAEPKKEEETPATETPAPVEAKKEEEAPATGVTATATATTPEASKDKKRTSFFGNLTGSVKKEKSEGEADGEAKHTNPIGGLFRKASQMGKKKDAKKETTTPPKVDEEPTKDSSAPVIPAPETEATPAPAPEASKTNQNSIGDVVPDAVTVGQAPSASPAVHATA